MTSPRQKKKKLALLKMLKKQKEAAASALEKTAVENMNKNLLKTNEKHATDQIDQKLPESSEQVKNALKELKNKKTTKSADINQNINTNNLAKPEETEKVNDT